MICGCMACVACVFGFIALGILSWPVIKNIGFVNRLRWKVYKKLHKEE